MVRGSRVAVVGAMYDVACGRIDFLSAEGEELQPAGSVPAEVRDEQADNVGV